MTAFIAGPPHDQGPAIDPILAGRVPIVGLLQGHGSSGGVRVSEEAIRQYVARILNSPLFANASRLRAFLLFVVRETLEGRKDSIKEYSIGRAVCGRPASFNPKADPVVRVDANRLRSRLQAYYESDGRGDEVVIELPKGGYVPVFRPGPLASRAAENGYKSLAVLPFANLNRPGQQNQFSEGLTEELIHALTRLPGLRVVARSSVGLFKGRPVDGRQAGQRLHVDYVLEGSVRLAEGRWRIAAQVIDIAHGWLMCSEKYECPRKGIFEAQDRIAASLAETLRLEIAPPDVTPR